MTRYVRMHTMRIDPVDEEEERVVNADARARRSPTVHLVRVVIEATVDRDTAARLGSLLE